MNPTGEKELFTKIMKEFSSKWVGDPVIIKINEKPSADALEKVISAFRALGYEIKLIPQSNDFQIIIS